MKKLLSILMLLVAIVTGAWAEDATIFSITDIKKADVAVAQGGGEYTLKSTDATIVGGTVLLHNGKSGTGTDKMLNTNGQVNLGASGGCYFLATITTAGEKIAKGDVIKIASSDANFYISGTSTKPGSATTFTNGEYSVPEGSNLINATTVYIWKGETRTFTSFTITRLDPSNVVTPSIAFSSNKATITCATANATIRYTLDGTEPTSSSTEYTAAIDLTNSCTVRAKAFKDENESNEATKDCYVDHSAAEGFLTILKFNGGSVGTGDAAKVWTSTDGKYVLTDKNNDQTNKWSNLEGSQDAFKLSHVDGYTLAVPSNVKITKVVFIGKSLYQNYAGTVAMTTAGFTPTNASFIQNADEEGFVKYLSTIEFTNSSLNYGDAIDFNPGGCESAAYIELYGEIKQNAIAYDDAVENGTISGAASAAEGVTVTVTATPADGYEFGELVIMNGETDVTSECSVEGTTFVMPAYDVTVSATFQVVQTPIVTLPTEEREGYSCDGTTTTVSRSQAKLNGQTVYSIGNGSSVIVTVPATTTVSKVRVWGTSSDGNSSNVTIYGAGEERSETKNFNNRDAAETSSVEFIPTTQTTSYTVTSTTKGSWVFIEVYGEETPTTETITTDNDVATYVTKHALDFTGLETKAYVVTGVNAGKTKVLTQEVTTVPANTALLIKGNTVDVPVIEDADAPATNLFQVSNGSVVQNTDKTIFVYSKTAKAFKRLGTATIPNGKCYIIIEGVPEATQSLDVDIEGEATAITNVNANENANSAAPVKIIKNGKLYIGNYNVAGQLVK